MKINVSLQNFKKKSLKEKKSNSFRREKML